MKELQKLKDNIEKLAEMVGRINFVMREISDVIGRKLPKEKYEEPKNCEDAIRITRLRDEHSPK